MVSKKIKKALEGSSVIRAMFTEGKEMAKNTAQRMFMISVSEIRRLRLRKR